jgi:hypothetical protein
MTVANDFSFKILCSGGLHLNGRKWSDAWTDGMGERPWLMGSRGMPNAACSLDDMIMGRNRSLQSIETEAFFASGFMIIGP